MLLAAEKECGPREEARGLLVEAGLRAGLEVERGRAVVQALKGLVLEVDRGLPAEAVTGLALEDEHGLAVEPVRGLVLESGLALNGGNGLELAVCWALWFEGGRGQGRSPRPTM